MLNQRFSLSYKIEVRSCKKTPFFFNEIILICMKSVDII